MNLNYDGEYGMWQYSATGNVLGIDTMVDLNYAYKDFPQINRRRWILIILLIRINKV